MPADTMASRSMFWAAKADFRVVARHTSIGARNALAGAVASMMGPPPWLAPFFLRAS